MLNLSAQDLEHARLGATVFVPVNPIEYHGPHLSLRNDALVSQGLIRDLHQRLAARHPEQAPLLCLPDLDVGVDPTPGPGSQPVSFQEVRARVLAVCQELAAAQVRRVVLMTFHGSPLHSIAIDAGVQWLAARGIRALAPLNLVLHELLDLDGARYAEAYQGVADAAERERLMRDAATDFHAGFFETSVALHYAPDSVSPRFTQVPPCPDFGPAVVPGAIARVLSALGARGLGAELRLAAHGLSWYALRPFPGYTGRPHLASAAAGAVFARLISERFEQATEAVFADQAAAPRPILRWLPIASFGGRVGSPHIRQQDMRPLQLAP